MQWRCPVRQYVANYDSTLPDFICLEIEQRYIATRNSGRAGSEPSFRLMDTISSKITYFQHQEKKDAILDGRRPVTTDYEKLGGATSRGDFETALRMLFDPATQAHFEWARWTTWHGRLTMVFDYHVSRDRSQYQIGVQNPKVERVTAYSGEVFVDAEAPHPVVRMTLQGRRHSPGLPPPSRGDYPSITNMSISATRGPCCHITAKC